MNKLYITSLLMKRLFNILNYYHYLCLLILIHCKNFVQTRNVVDIGAAANEAMTYPRLPRSASAISSHSRLKSAEDGDLPARRYQCSALDRSPSTRCR